MLLMVSEGKLFGAKALITFSGALWRTY